MKIAFSILSMFVGGMIYIAFREDSLMMFDWFRRIGISAQIGLLRECIAPVHSSLPSFVVFSVPNALWYFSGLLAFSTIWHEQKERIL